MNRKNRRQWVLGSALLGVCLLVWWVQIYSPLQDRLEESSVDLDTAMQQHERLVRRLTRLSDGEQDNAKNRDELDYFSNLMVEGQSLEEINAITQLLLQEFLEKHEISLDAYKELAPSKWRQYDLGRVELRLNTTTQGLSDFLEFLEALKKVIRIERLTVNYRRRKENGLQVSLHLATLFVEDVDVIE